MVVKGAWGVALGTEELWQRHKGACALFVPSHHSATLPH